MTEGMAANLPDKVERVELTMQVGEKKSTAIWLNIDGERAGRVMGYLNGLLGEPHDLFVNDWDLTKVYVLINRYDPEERNGRQYPSGYVLITLELKDEWGDGHKHWQRTGLYGVTTLAACLDKLRDMANVKSMVEAIPITDEVRLPEELRNHVASGEIPIEWKPGFREKDPAYLDRVKIFLP